MRRYKVEQILDMYKNLGVSRQVYEYGEKALDKLKERFAARD